jgi:hypothetical protein
VDDGGLDSRRPQEGGDYLFWFIGIMKALHVDDLEEKLFKN